MLYDYKTNTPIRSTRKKQWYVQEDVSAVVGWSSQV